jgi:hypothetical protein
MDQCSDYIGKLEGTVVNWMYGDRWKNE